MSERQDKKLRQLAKEQEDKQFKTTLADLQQKFISRMDALVKEPPKWFPRILWYKLASIFLNI